MPKLNLSVCNHGICLVVDGGSLRKEKAQADDDSIASGQAQRSRNGHVEMQWWSKPS